MDTAAVLGNAMADGLLAVGANRALTVCAPEHVAQWLDAHSNRLGRAPANIDALSEANGSYLRSRRSAARAQEHRSLPRPQGRGAPGSARHGWTT